MRVVSLLPPPAAPVSASSGVDRVRVAWQRRPETDYIFNFWSALGWSVLTCGFYGIYVMYQLVRRNRDHNIRRIEFLEGAMEVAWVHAARNGRAEEFRPVFERMQANLAPMRQLQGEFRDPSVWAVLAFVASGIAQIIWAALADNDRLAHDRAEGAVEADLAFVYGQLGVSVPMPDSSRIVGPHNIGGRVAATILSCGLYWLWWEYDIMKEWNDHFRVNWAWEDAVAQAVQTLEGLVPTASTSTEVAGPAEFVAAPPATPIVAEPNYGIPPPPPVAPPATPVVSEPNYGNLPPAGEQSAAEGEADKPNPVPPE